MDPDFEIKPSKKVFVKYRFAVSTVILLIVLSVVFLIVNVFLPGLIVYFLTAFVLLSALKYYSLNVRYKKERYLFFKGRIIAKGGGIFHDRSTELVIRNITHITLVKPFIENNLFKTGHILIELAGSAFVEGRIISVDRPEEGYSKMLKLMRANGFRLAKKKLVQKEKPSLLGVLFETLGVLIGVGIFLLWFVVGLAFAAAAFFGPGIIILFFVLGIALVIFIPYLRFMDLSRRTYYIYNDTIIYNEGFLTKKDSFIPIENLADSELTQTLVDKIFGLYDVRVSCQGVGHEILFKNIRNGNQMETNIDSLINQSKPLVGTGKKIISEAAKKFKIAPGKSKALIADTAYTTNFKMDFVRTMAPAVFPLLAMILLLIVGSLFTLILMPGMFGTVFGLFSLLGGIAVIVLVFGVVGAAIKVGATNYSVKPKGMEETYNFLNKRDIEFSNEKVTGITFRENFIDNWFKTISIRFWSIGASYDINFSNIKKISGLRETILAKYGIKEQQPIYKIESDFSASAMFKATFFLSIAAIIVFIAMIFGAISFNALFWIPAAIMFFGYIALVIYKYAFYKRSKLYFFKDYAYFQKGIFFRSYYYALYDNIKDITTKRYPFASLGHIKFNVAGESIAYSGKYSKKGGAQQQLVSHHFKINYAQKIQDMDELIDLIFYKRPTAVETAQIASNIKSYSAKNIVFEKPVLANSLFWTIIFLAVLNIVISFFLWQNPLFVLILPAMLVLDLLILVYIVLSVKFKSYAIQPYRVIAKSGILYKTQTSIVFSKIDHLKTFQGLTNKMFGNGSITVHTIGSRLPEIKIMNIDKFSEFYSALEQYY